MGELRERRRVALPLAGRPGRHDRADRASSWPSTRAGPRRTAGARRCPPTPRSRSACWPWSAASLPDRVRTYLLTFAVVDDLTAHRRHRGRLQRASCSCPRCWSGWASWPWSPWPRRAGLRYGPVVRPARAGRLGGVLQVRRRPGGGRPGDRPADPGLPGRPRRPGAGHRPVPAVPRAAHRGAGPGGPRRRRTGHLPERAAAADLPPLDQLRHRAAVRAGQRGRRDQRGAALAGPSPRRSRSASWSATWSASRSAPPASAWLVTRLSRGRIRPPVGWAAVAGAGTIAGIGFTVSLLIASLAFHGEQLAEAKLGMLAAALARVRAHLGGVPGDRAAPEAAAAPRAARHGRGDHRPGRAGRPAP